MSGADIAAWATVLVALGTWLWDRRVDRRLRKEELKTRRRELEAERAELELQRANGERERAYKAWKQAICLLPAVKESAVGLQKLADLLRNKPIKISEKQADVFYNRALQPFSVTSTETAMFPQETEEAILNYLLLAETVYREFPRRLDPDVDGGYILSHPLREEKMLWYIEELLKLAKVAEAKINPIIQSGRPGG